MQILGQGSVPSQIEGKDATSATTTHVEASSSSTMPVRMSSRPSVATSSSAAQKAAKKRGLAGRVIWGMTPVVTYPVSALSNKMLSGIPTCTSFVRNISAVAKLVGRGMKDYGIPGYDNCLAPLCENMQAIRIKVSDEDCVPAGLQLTVEQQLALAEVDQIENLAQLKKRVAEAEDGYEAHWAKYTEAKAQQWQAEDALVNLHIKIGGNAMQIRRAPGFEELSVEAKQAWEEVDPVLFAEGIAPEPAAQGQSKILLQTVLSCQNKAYRAGKTVWQKEKELRGMRQLIDTWQAHVQRAEAELTFTQISVAMHKSDGADVGAGPLRHNSTSTA